MNFLDLLVDFKVRMMRAQSHVGYMFQAVMLTISIATLLKVNNQSMWYSVAVFIVILGVQLIIGVLDIRFRVFEKEIAMNNKYNPEIQELIRRGEKK